jgi:hypothetical protein
MQTAAWGPEMTDGLAAIIGAAIGAIATAAGVIVQAVLRNRADAERRRETRERDLESQRRELARRYLFQVQDAVVSLRMRLDNWAWRGGQRWSESVDPGYWDITTLFAIGRALAAERILSLEGVYALIDQQSDLADPLRRASVDKAVRVSLRRLFYYHRLALAESMLERSPDGYRLLMYTKWRRRYEDPSSGLDCLLEPTMSSLQDLRPQTDLERLINSIDDIAICLGKETGVRSAVMGDQDAPAPHLQRKGSTSVAQAD